MSAEIIPDREQTTQPTATTADRSAAGSLCPAYAADPGAFVWQEVPPGLRLPADWRVGCFGQRPVRFLVQIGAQVAGGTDPGRLAYVTNRLGELEVLPVEALGEGMTLHGLVVAVVRMYPDGAPQQLQGDQEVTR